ncbi:23869_t:CDS:2 [Gigaspora margarita]|uniref:23869_t:CDS:1 n=1 Tax=Gigaspora margarita TaxID=4874 RepID=A0ABN7VH66_GIGMA|nr:23869_t:CDS:2 [Gigaspora margarita]
MSNWPLTNECATKMAYIRLNAINSNETSNETCLEEIISNVKFDDMDYSDNKLEQFEEENLMQTIANIDNFNTNDQITYNKQ